VTQGRTISTNKVTIIPINKAITPLFAAKSFLAAARNMPFACQAGLLSGEAISDQQGSWCRMILQQVGHPI
jgi:hypothetical protein